MCLCPVCLCVACICISSQCAVCREKKDKKVDIKKAESTPGSQLCLLLVAVATSCPSPPPPAVSVESVETAESDMSSVE